MFEDWQPGTPIDDLPECPHFGGGLLELPRRYPDGQSVPFRVNGHTYQGFPTGQDFSLVQYVTTNGLGRDHPDFQYNENLAVRNIVQTFAPISPHVPTDGARHHWEAVGDTYSIFGSNNPPHDEVPYQYFLLGDLVPVLEWVPFEVGDDYFSCSGEYFSNGAFSYQYETGTAEIVLFPRPDILYWRAISVVSKVGSVMPMIGALLFMGLGMIGSAGMCRRRRKT